MAEFCDLIYTIGKASNNTAMIASQNLVRLMLIKKLCKLLNLDKAKVRTNCRAYDGKNELDGEDVCMALIRNWSSTWDINFYSEMFLHQNKN